FDLGANSITLIHVLGIVNKVFEKELKPILLFQYPNVNELVNHVFDQAESSTFTDEEDLLAEELEDIMDLMD
ncbi:MAG: acyl carrier protein, partial [Bacteroidota bacterium]